MLAKHLGWNPDVIDRIAKAQAYWDNWEVFQQGLAKQGLQLDGDLVQKLCLLVK